METSDNRDVEKILETLAADARAAFQAELDFFQGRSDNLNAPFAEFSRRYVEWCDASEPYVRSYRRMDQVFRSQMSRFEAIAKPIHDEILGTA